MISKKYESISSKISLDVEGNEPKTQIIIMRKLAFFILCLVVSSCTQAPYRGGDAVGAEEFVLDSYKIREGKVAIMEMEGKFLPPLTADLFQEYAEVIAEGDLLTISIYHPHRPDLVKDFQQLDAQNAFRVSNEKIFLPDIGHVRVAGLTIEEAKENIEERYQERIKDLTLFVDYKARANRNVELAGLVSSPMLPVNGKLRLFEALALARVPANANLYRSYILRDNQPLALDMHRLVREGDLSQNIVLRTGDKVYIAEPSASSAMVLGEVGRPHVIALPNGFMTLRQALGEAGGLAITADRRYIQIFRGSAVCPKIYTLHWRHVITLPADSLLVMPGDMVYVAATPITEWSRFVNQILPTLIGIDLLTKGVKSVGVNLP